MRTLTVALLFLVAACGGPEAPLVATDVDVTRPMPGRGMSAGYMVLTNNTTDDIRITKVTSPQFGAVAVHETTIDADGVARMREVEALVVPAGGSVVLERGGKHLMLNAGEFDRTVTLQLYSGDAPVLTVTHTFDAG